MPLSNNSNSRKRMSGRLLLGLASFVAIFATAYLGFWFLVARFELIDNYNTLNILNFVRDIAAMTVIGLAGLAFFVRRRWFILLIYLALLGAAITFMILFHFRILF
ncbi:MAG: hypothetical protein FWC80_03205 [Firmicutes bacterium]|nr:hypothetical protein [Bacillota bacterium]